MGSRVGAVGSKSLSNRISVVGVPCFQVLFCYVQRSHYEGYLLLSSNASHHRWGSSATESPSLCMALLQAILHLSGELLKRVINASSVTLPSLSLSVVPHASSGQDRRPLRRGPSPDHPLIRFTAIRVDACPHSTHQLRSSGDSGVLRLPSYYLFGLTPAITGRQRAAKAKRRPYVAVVLSRSEVEACDE